MTNPSSFSHRAVTVEVISSRGYTARLTWAGSPPQMLGCHYDSPAIAAEAARRTIDRMDAECGVVDVERFELVA